MGQSRPAAAPGAVLGPHLVNPTPSRWPGRCRPSALSSCFSGRRLHAAAPSARRHRAAATAGGHHWSWSLHPDWCTSTIAAGDLRDLADARLRADGLRHQVGGRALGRGLEHPVAHRARHVRRPLARSWSLAALKPDPDVRGLPSARRPTRRSSSPGPARCGASWRLSETGDGRWWSAAGPFHRPVVDRQVFRRVAAADRVLLPGSLSARQRHWLLRPQPDGSPPCSRWRCSRRCCGGTQQLRVVSLRSRAAAASAEMGGFAALLPDCSSPPRSALLTLGMSSSLAAGALVQGAPVRRAGVGWTNRDRLLLLSGAVAAALHADQFRLDREDQLACRRWSSSSSAFATMLGAERRRAPPGARLVVGRDRRHRGGRRRGAQPADRRATCQQLERLARRAARRHAAGRAGAGRDVVQSSRRTKISSLLRFYLPATRAPTHRTSSRTLLRVRLLPQLTSDLGGPDRHPRRLRPGPGRRRHGARATRTAAAGPRRRPRAFGKGDAAHRDPLCIELPRPPRGLPADVGPPCPCPSSPSSSPPSTRSATRGRMRDRVAAARRDRLGDDLRRRRPRLTAPPTRCVRWRSIRTGVCTRIQRIGPARPVVGLHRGRARVVGAAGGGDDADHQHDEQLLPRMVDAMRRRPDALTSRRRQPLCESGGSRRLGRGACGELARDATVAQSCAGPTCTTR